jgi:hypothetical protein
MRPRFAWTWAKVMLQPVSANYIIEVFVKHVEMDDGARAHRIQLSEQSPLHTCRP